MLVVFDSPVLVESGAADPGAVPAGVLDMPPVDAPDVPDVEPGMLPLLVPMLPVLPVLLLPVVDEPDVPDLSVEVVEPGAELVVEGLDIGDDDDELVSGVVLLLQAPSAATAAAMATHWIGRSIGSPLGWLTRRRLRP